MNEALTAAVRKQGAHLETQAGCAGDVGSLAVHTRRRREENEDVSHCKGGMEG